MFLAFLLPGLAVMCLLANWLMLREVRKALPNATRQQRIHELSKAWNSAGLSLMSLPKAEQAEPVKRKNVFQIEEEDTPT